MILLRRHVSWFSIWLAMALLLPGCGKPPEQAVALPAPDAAAAAGNVSDMDVTEHVKTALHQSAALQSFDIGVVTIKGDVRLIGVLDSQTQIDEALRITRASDGVHAIHDELTVKP